MRDLIGKWRVAEMIVYNDDTDEIEFMKVADLLADPMCDKDMKLMGNAIYEFDNDNKIHVMTPIPEGVSKKEVDEAVASGAVVLTKDGLISLSTMEWKMENGKPYFNTETEAEFLGETISPWVEIKEVGDLIELATYRLARI